MLRLSRLAILAALACPAQQPVLTIYSRTVEMHQLPQSGKDAHEAIDRVLFEEFAKANRLDPSEAELAGIRRKLRLTLPESPSPQPQDLFTAALVTGFKVNRFLWNKHGGRLVLSAFGFHMATDGWIAEIVLLERRGLVRFHRRDLRESYLRRLRNYGGDGVVSGSEAQRILSRAPWE
jgi:hypothetical protein